MGLGFIRFKASTTTLAFSSPMQTCPANSAGRCLPSRYWKCSHRLGVTGIRFPTRCYISSCVSAIWPPATTYPSSSPSVTAFSTSTENILNLLYPPPLYTSKAKEQSTQPGRLLFSFSILRCYQLHQQDEQRNQQNLAADCPVPPGRVGGLDGHRREERAQQDREDVPAVIPNSNSQRIKNCPCAAVAALLFTALVAAAPI